MMKKLFIGLLIVFSCLTATAQISVKSFQALPMDMTATSLEGKRIDQNNEVCALIKIVTTQTGFTFEAGALGIVDSKQETGEVWVWVPRGSRKITIKHQQLGVLREYRYPIEIESERTYEMVLTTAKIETIVKEEVHEQFLTFEITPHDAVLEVNDQQWTVSATGSASKMVNFGTYSYRVQALNYHPDAGRVTVDDPDNTTKVTINLKPNFGWIEVPGNGLLQGAAVYVDNALIGKAPCKSEALKSGQHNIRIMKELYEPYTSVVTVNDNETTTINPNLTADFAHVTLQVDADAEIWVNNELKGTRSWSGDLSTGVYRIECKLANHETSLTTKEVTNQLNGDVIQLEAPRPIYGSLMVESEPISATIFIDGKEVGESPKLIKEILIGQHNIRLTKPNHTDYSETITIAKGERKQVRATLAKAEFYAKGKAFYDKNDYTQAFQLFQQGANAGDAESQVMLGRMYYNGKGVEQDCEQARRWFQQAADQNNGDAFAWMSDIYVEEQCNSVDYEKALQLIHKAIELGSAYGMNNLGFMYQNGFGVTQDYNEAVKWYRQAAENGDPVGMLDLSVMYAQGRGVAKDDAEALKWRRRSAELGHASGLYSLGQTYHYGSLGVTKDYNEAIKWYKKASDQGRVDALHSIGSCYAGLNNPQEAAKWYRKAADQGYKPAQNALGNCYYNGYGVSKDYNEAAKWYRKAADDGYATAQRNLGYCHQMGYGVSKDEKEAIRLYRLAADKGYADAMNDLGWCYQNGIGVSKNYKEAMNWYRKAAEKGHSMGNWNLGYCYEEGYGVEKNPQEAFRFYKIAAEKGLSRAQNAVGNCYKNGYGVTKDLNEARKWYQKAADQGNENAKENLKKLR